MAAWRKCFGSILLAASLGVVALTGCNTKTEPGTPPDSNTTLSDPATKPNEVVTRFLQSLKDGDQLAATSLLTAKAQAEMARTQAVIQPPGSSSAEFSVTEVEYVDENRQGAHVLSVWSDVDDQGQSTEHEIVWILRQEPSAGWAVAGFATKVFADQPPLILNFEDPLDLQRKRSAVDDEIARRSDADGPMVQQAQREAPNLH